MKFLRTIRFDASDGHIFETAASSDEWAVPGGFVFAGCEPGELAGKHRQAFANGFWSLQSCGHATLTSVAEIEPGRVEGLIEDLARLMLERLGAPDRQAALAAARQEIGFTLDLCRDLPVNTLLAVSRAQDDDGAVKERFRILKAPTGAAHARVWDVVEDDADGT